MDTNTRRLGTSFNRSINTNVQSVVTPEFTTYCTLVSNLLSNRFPLEQIDSLREEDIERVSQLAVFSVPIIVSTWTRYQQSIQNPEQQRRAA